MQSFVLGLMTLTMVLVGLSVVVFVAFLPLLEFSLLDLNTTGWIVLSIFIQIIHLRLLWTSTVYLMVLRTLVFPIRKLVMPLAMAIVRIEAIREETPVLYLDLARIEPNEELSEVERLMQYFRPSIRRRYKKMEEKFHDRRIRIESGRSETTLNLSQILPVMWDHERRCCERDGKSLVAEFIKRFLVMSLCTNGILDRYYDQNASQNDDGGDLVCIQLSVQQDDVLHWFMYFSSDSRSGIWYHGILNSMVRGLQTPGVRYVNAQNHQTESKTSAGLRQSDCHDDDIMSDLYPWTFLQDLPEESIETKLWSGLEVSSSPNRSG